MLPRVSASSNRSRLEIERQLDLAQRRNVTFTFVQAGVHIGRCGFTVVDLWMCINWGGGDRMKHESIIIALYCLLRKQLEAVYPANTRSNRFEAG